MIHSLPLKNSSRSSAIFHHHAKCFDLISFGLFWSDVSLSQICNTEQAVLFWLRFLASLVIGPSFVNYTLLLVEYTRSYLPYVQPIFIMLIQWLHHAIVTTDPLTRCRLLKDPILFVYVMSPNNRALKVSIPLLRRHV
jgi:hypothetical protein